MTIDIPRICLAPTPRPSQRPQVGTYYQFGNDILLCIGAYGDRWIFAGALGEPGRLLTKAQTDSLIALAPVKAETLCPPI